MKDYDRTVNIFDNSSEFIFLEIYIEDNLTQLSKLIKFDEDDLAGVGGAYRISKDTLESLGIIPYWKEEDYSYELSVISIRKDGTIRDVLETNDKLTNSIEIYSNLTNSIFLKIYTSNDLNKIFKYINFDKIEHQGVKRKYKLPQESLKYFGIVPHWNKDKYSCFLVTEENDNELS